MCFFFFFVCLSQWWQETDEDAEPSLEDSQDAWEGNKDAARALFRVKQKLDGYEDAEMRSVQGQVFSPFIEH